MAGLEGEVELLRVRGAELYLVDGNHTALLQKGDMAVVLSLQRRLQPITYPHRHGALAAVVASVGDLHWPIAKDSPAMSLGDGRYAFSLPGPFLYGLALPTSSTSPQQTLALDGILQRYSTFGSHLPILPGNIGNNVNEGEDTTRANCSAWASLASIIETELSSLVEMKQIPSSSTSNLQKSKPMSKPKSNSMSMLSNTRVMNCRMLKQTQGARRMSAVAKLISKMVVVGGIDVSLHVYPHINMHGNGHAAEVVVASAHAFSSLLEAIESRGRSLCNLKHNNNNNNNNNNNSSNNTNNSNNNSSSSFVGLYPQLEGNNNWTLNIEGLSKLLQITFTSLKCHENISTQSSSLPYVSRFPSSSLCHDNNPPPCLSLPPPQHYVPQQYSPKENK